jgi:hypothetical protein
MRQALMRTRAKVTWRVHGVGGVGMVGRLSTESGETSGPR